MKKFGIELKWAVIFSLVSIFWSLLEKSIGFHDTLIEQHAFFNRFFVIPALAVYLLALHDKRINSFGNRMGWIDGFLTGLAMSVLIAVFMPPVQLITVKLISPDFLVNFRNYAIETGKMSVQVAENYYELTNYILQNVYSALIFGTTASALAALFLRKKE